MIKALAPLRKLDEPWIGSGLTGAEYDRHTPRCHAVRQSREIAVAVFQARSPLNPAGQTPSKVLLSSRHINDGDIETNASPRVPCVAPSVGPRT
jgi:hypothetical protein